MSLRSYVLAAWLHEVAAAANDRLRVLSGGRYTFVPSTARESRGRTGGLGLDVLDEYSGKSRPTKTLSGGESFLASLALALGLADVVAGQTGVGLLNTMFIDEGFGTLDADSLDLVMETLDSLRGEGRVIGVVSHVDELRQRIPSRLRVLRSAAGSTVELTASGAGDGAARMITLVCRFVDTAADFLDTARAPVALLAAQPTCRSARLARSTDDASRVDADRGVRQCARLPAGAEPVRRPDLRRPVPVDRRPAAPPGSSRSPSAPTRDGSRSTNCWSIRSAGPVPRVAACGSAGPEH